MMYSLDYSDAILLYYLFFAKYVNAFDKLCVCVHIWIIKNAFHCRILPAIVTFFCNKYFNINIKFKSLSLLNACVQNIHLKWSNYEIVSFWHHKTVNDWTLLTHVTQCWNKCSPVAKVQWFKLKNFFHLQTVGELGLKSKFFSSEYKKPFCISLEDVKINQLLDNDLQTKNTTQKSLSQIRHEREEVEEGKEDDATRYKIVVRDNFKKVLDYLVKFLPPTAMIFAQVNTHWCLLISGIFLKLMFLHQQNPVFRNLRQKFFNGCLK